MNEVVIFAPSPVLTVTVEGRADHADIHLHAGGQGVWQARMLQALGASVTMCCVLTGETGQVLGHLVADEGIRVLAVRRAGRGAAYVHDRRGGERSQVAATQGEPLSRHDLDELYDLTLRAGLGADAIVLSGPAGEDVVPADVYRRLAADLRSTGRFVIADLAGERLTAALGGKVSVVKVSDDELLADGRISAPDEEQLFAAAYSLRDEGADTVIISRAEKPLLLLADDTLSEVCVPTMQIADPHGAGDSLTAGVAATLAAGGTIEEAVSVGAAAGALNVTRHGLGTGKAETVRLLRDHVRVYPVEWVPAFAKRLTPDELAQTVQNE
ncbi:phosphofructokinase [Cryobacterium sp. TMT1-21]|uniref:Phosphofructokinase n=1 Tax=Cryobacterium shii TaxID=1259235 RepID=A0AAQ2C460_9MICO|nr:MULTISPECIES: PfkB family carbohydrate kinase [Cryobacterium]TFC42297.1 phosphofructokinase [Cryobacterium shii]TFC85965.1 phosphofructokinase [Cryobacterium sp. TmT2-59]TFD13704.1 phosphofructokinase [Cryobacterium sp. TMT4-10]TFD15931.1 phosphofructokinase [Cryobacterium sp. TMT1-21]